MRKSVRREYEHKRSYDYADFDSMKGRRVTKNRSHHRLRKQLKADIVAADKEGESYYSAKQMFESTYLEEM